MSVFTYNSNFFDDTIDSQSQKKKENTDDISSLFENPDWRGIISTPIDCGHFRLF